MHIFEHGKAFPRSETRLSVAGLQTARSALITYGPAIVAILLFLPSRAVLGDEAFFRYRVWGVFLAPLIFYIVVRWCRNRAHVVLYEGSVRVTAPLLGDIALELDDFQEAAIRAPEVPAQVRGVLSVLSAGLFLILTVRYFFSDAAVDPVNVLFAVVLLALAFQVHQQRDYKELELWFGVHTDWRRHVWSRRKVTFRGQEEVLQELKRQVEAAVNGLASP